MINGHFHEFVSCLTMAKVAMHCAAYTKNTINESATNVENTGNPVFGFISFFKDSDKLTISFPSPSTLYNVTKVLIITSRAANDVISQTPIFQSNPKGAIIGSIACPILPA